jgi:O-antigen/teichoic acid export membrane protein
MNGQSTEILVLPEQNGAGSPGDESSVLRQLREYIHLARGSDFFRKVLETYTTQISLIGIGLATTVTVARALGPEGRGLYAVAIAVGALGVQFGNLGLPASNTYYLSQDRTLLPRLLGNSLLVSAIVGGTGALAAWLVFSLHPELAPLHGPLLKFGLAWVPLGLCFLLMQRLNLGLYEVRSYNKIEVMNRGCALALIGIVILSRRISPQTVITANLIALTIGCFWALRGMRPWLTSFPWPSWRLLRQHLGLGVKAYFITALSFLHMRVALLMVKYMLGPQQAGYYSVASGLGDYILLLPVVIGLILFPKLSAIASVPEKLRQAKTVALGTALALIPFLTVTVIVVKPAVRILFGRPFLPAADVFPWLVPGIFMIGVEIATVQFLNSVGYPKILVGVWASSVLVDVLLNLWAIPHFGIRGAALVRSISDTVALIGVLLIIRLRYSGYSEKLQVKAVA